MPEALIADSIATAIRAATRMLRQAGSETPRLDAELLLAEVLGTDRTQLVLDAHGTLEPHQLERFEQLVARRVAREPVAYIIGRKGFRSITLAVDPRVLIPRPETELLVEVGVTLAAGVRVVDVGTGSGAIALALKSERPDLEIVGTDISADALAVARANAARLALDVTLTEGDLLAEIECDAVLANLPYVASSAPAAPDVARYEPAGALHGGEDGLHAIERLVQSLPAAVTLAALEVAFDQADAVSNLLQHAGYGEVERLRDLAGHDRVVVGRR